MNQYRNNKLPESFTNKFRDITCTDQLQTRQNDYNYLNIPEFKKSLESFPCTIKTWNSLSIDVKGSVWESDKLILNDGRWFPETADVIIFSEKFVF